MCTCGPSWACPPRTDRAVAAAIDFRGGHGRFAVIALDFAAAATDSAPVVIDSVSGRRTG
jgi:hypothetical protein